MGRGIAAAAGVAVAAVAAAIAIAIAALPPDAPAPEPSPAAPLDSSPASPEPPRAEGAPPSVVAVRAASPDGEYGAGETILIDVVFSESVAAAGSDDPSSAAVVLLPGLFEHECGARGGPAARACYSEAEVHVQVGSTVTWVNNDTWAHFIMGVAPDKRHMPAFYSGRVGPGSSFAHTFDEPGTYGFYSGMNAPERGYVHVEARAPLLALDTGCTGRNATHAGSAPSAPARDAASAPPPSDTLRFEYAVRPGDRSEDLGYAGTRALSASLGIAGISGRAADLALPAPGSPGSLSAGANISVLAPMRPHLDDVPPCVLAVRAASPDGEYGAGETVLIDVVFSESVAVAVAGAPAASAAGGAPPGIAAGDAAVRILPMSSLPECGGDGNCYSDREVWVEAGSAVTWINGDADVHTVTSGNLARGPDGLFDSGLMEPGSAFEHTFGRPASYPYYCGLHPWMAGAVHVGSSSSSSSGGGGGSMPLLALDTGGAGRNATHVAAAGLPPDTLRFEYAVRPGDRSADLEYAGARALWAVPGRISDAAGNAADLALPAAGSPGSLSRTSDISVSG